MNTIEKKMETYRITPEEIKTCINLINIVLLNAKKCKCELEKKRVKKTYLKQKESLKDLEILLLKLKNLIN